MGDKFGNPIQPSSTWLAAKASSNNSPYFPQIGDELVYFREGHQYYVDHVLQNHLYEIDRKQLRVLPWNIDHNLPAAIPVRLVGLTYRNQAELKPPALAVLELQIGQWDTGVLTGKFIKNIEYHHIPEAPDFLVLRQVYQRSIGSNWHIGDRCRKLVDAEWWLGTISNVKPLSHQFPDSKFRSLHIKFDQRPEMAVLMSPWEVEEVPDVFEIPEGTRDGVLPASPAEIRSGLYEPGPLDWVPLGRLGREAECDRISRLLTCVMTRGLALNFVNPVDLKQYPHYLLSIPYPVDLSTIKARLDNRFYRRREALDFDIKFIAINAEIFNLPTTDIVKRARVIRDLCLRLSSDPNITDVEAEYVNIFDNFVPNFVPTLVEKLTPETIFFPLNGIEVKEEPVVQASTSAAPPLPNAIFSSNPNVNHHPHGSNHANAGSSKSWKGRCKEILNTLWNSSDSVPFRAPVDILQFPNYYQLVDAPMDLQAVREDFAGGNYKSATEFAKDIYLIISNSRKFNTDENSESKDSDNDGQSGKFRCLPYFSLYNRQPKELVVVPKSQMKYYMYQITSRFAALFDNLIEPVLPADSLRRQLQQRRHTKSRSQVLRDKYSQESPIRSPNPNGMNSPGSSRRYFTRKRSFPNPSRLFGPETNNPERSVDSLATQKSIEQHLRSIDDSLKEIVRLKELKYANLGLL